jgi:AcrR family transcriptional regulator
VIDAEGLTAMTMRRVAERLDTGAASLYAHVGGKEEIVELVVERVIGELELPGTPDPARWQEQLKDIVRSMRATLAAHRDLAQGCLARIPVGPNALRGSEAMIDVMKAGGVPDQAIAYSVDFLSLYATATAYEESLFMQDGQLAPEDIVRYVGELRRYFEALPADRYPNTVAMAALLTAGGAGDERFEFGLELIVRGLASLVESGT